MSNHLSYVNEIKFKKSPSRKNADPSCFSFGDAPKNPPNPKLRTALINPPDPSTSDNSRLSLPLGLGYIASISRQHGHHVDIYDFALDFDICKMFENSGLLRGNYQIFGISSYTDNFQTTIHLSSHIKKMIPGAIVVLGGYHATLTAKDILVDFHEVDYVIFGEGEFPFLRLLDLIYEHKYESLALISDLAWRDHAGKVHINHVSGEYVNQETLPFPVTNLSYGSGSVAPYMDPNTGSEKSAIGIVGSRGCPKRCSFCSIVLINPLWRARTAESLITEIISRHREQPFEHIVFQDANCFVSPKRALDFARQLALALPGVTWSGTATPDHVVKNADIILELGSLNCSSLELGIESGNDNSLKRFKKGNTVQINEDALNLLNLAGIAPSIDFIMFEGFMRLPDVRENLIFLQRNELVGTWPPALLFQEVQLYPGTAQRKEHEDLYGVTTSIHVIPPLKFIDQSVELLFRCMQSFYARFQGNINQLVAVLHRYCSILPSARITSDSSEALASLGQKAAIIEIRLRHLPYDVFSILLARVEKIRLTAADNAPSEDILIEEVARLTGCVETIGTAIELVSELCQSFSRFGLKPKFPHELRATK